MKSINKPPALWHGIVLVSGGAIGAGMFALPIISAGPWFLWTMMGLALVWFMTYSSCAVLAKVNIALAERQSCNEEVQRSFSSLVAEILGPKWAIMNNLSILFILMILMYAYTTTSAGIAASFINQMGLSTSGIEKYWLSTSVAVVIGLIVYFGTAFVSRFSLAMILIMALLFVSVIASFTSSLSVEEPLSPQSSLSFLFGALPVYVTAFACAGLVPTLVGHYKNQPSYVFKSLFWGTLTTLFIYVIWISIAFGNISRENLSTVDNSDVIGNLVNAMSASISAHQAIAQLRFFPILPF